MSLKKIIIVCKSFYPLINPRSFRATELAIELAKQDHQVTVFIPFSGNNYNKFAKDNNLIMKDLGNLKWPYFQLTSSDKYLNLFKRAINRLLSLLFEYPGIELMFLVQKALKNEYNYDILISIAVPYPIHWGVASIRTKNHSIAKTWIADCGDPYMMNYIDSFRKPFYFKYVEKWFSRKADFITIPRIEMIDTFYPEFHSKIKAIPQGYNFENIKIWQGSVKNEIPTFGYAGGFIKYSRDPHQLLETLSKMDREFMFIVYTHKADMILQYINKLNGKLIVKKPVPREELLYELSKMDFLINIGYDPVIQSPSKLIDYSLTGRPILSLDSNAVDESILNDFLNGKYNSRFILDNIEKYNIKNVAAQFLSLENNID